MYNSKSAVFAEEQLRSENAKKLTKLSLDNMEMLPVLPKKTPWQQAVDNMQVNSLEKDVKIKIGKRLFECHSCVLHTFCDVFAMSTLAGSTLSLPESKVSAAAFEVAYNWMVSSDSNCQRGKLLDLLLAAHYLRAPKLLQSVFGALNDERYFANLDALNCYAEACTKRIASVADLMLGRISKSFLVLISSEEYRELEVQEVCALLAADSLAVHTEVEVFYAALLWVLSDYQERKLHMRRVLKAVRLELLPALVLHNLGEQLSELMPDAVDLMFFLLNLAVINNQERCSKPATSVPQRHRLHIRDPKCPYLHLLPHRVGELSTALFKDYIVSLADTFDQFQARIVELNEEQQM